MAFAACLLLAIAALFGGLPRSTAARVEAARDRLDAQAGATPATVAETTTTTAPPLPTVAEVEAALRAAGYPDVMVTIQERTVTVTGTVPDEASRRVVVQTVAQVAAVEGVDDQLQLAAVAARARVTIVAGSLTVEVAGTVPNQATAQAVLEPLQTRYRGGDIIGTVEIDPTLDADAPTTVLVEVSAIAPLGRLLETDYAEVGSTTPDSALVDVSIDATEPDVDRASQELAAIEEVQPPSFGAGAAVLADDDPWLVGVADTLSRFPDTSFTVVVHVGGGGDAALELSQARADAIVAALAASGLGNELIPVGIGGLRPWPDDLEPSRSDDRVDFVLLLDA